MSRRSWAAAGTGATVGATTSKVHHRHGTDGDEVGHFFVLAPLRPSMPFTADEPASGNEEWRYEK